MYKDLVEVRPLEVDGISDWVWPKSDRGAWDGPVRDWVRTHRETYLKFVKTRGVVVQAGGNCGLYPRLFSKYFKLVYTFEPDPFNFYCLVQNCQVDNVVKFQAALGDSVNKSQVSIERLDMTNVGMHRVVNDGDGFIPQFSIDALGLRACDLIQLDVEGYEVHALRGALETIKAYHPVISVETGRGESCHNFLTGLGYAMVAEIDIDRVYVFKE